MLDLKAIDSRSGESPALTYETRFYLENLPVINKNFSENTKLLIKQNILAMTATNNIILQLSQLSMGPGTNIVREENLKRIRKNTEDILQIMSGYDAAAKNSKCNN